MQDKINIEILRVTHLRGPNIWTYRPVIEAWVDIGELENHPSNTIPGFYERLTALLPGLIEHECSPGVRGGFLQRLQEGTWAAHILEHVCLEMQNLAGMRTGFGKARSTSTPGVYKIAFRTRHEDVGRAALEAGRALLLSAIQDTPFDMAKTVADLTEMVDDLCLGPSTAHIVDAATARRIPNIRLTSGNLVQLGYGKAQRRIWTAETDQTSAIAEEIARTCTEGSVIGAIEGDLSSAIAAGCFPLSTWAVVEAVATPAVIGLPGGDRVGEEKGGVACEIRNRERDVLLVPGR